MGNSIFCEKNNKQEVGEDFKRFRSEPRICFRKNQNKVEEPFLKLLHHEMFYVMLHRGKNFRELDLRSSLTEAVIKIFSENGCTI